MDEPRSRTVPVALWVLVLEIVVIVLLVSGSWMQRVNRAERGWMLSTLGANETESIERRTMDWYNKLVVDSGMLDSAYRTFLPAAPNPPAAGLDRIGEGAWSLVRDRLQGLFAVVYEVLLRSAGLLAWSPFLIVAGAPAIIDGIMAWRIRRESFQNTSVIMHRTALRLMGGSLTALILLLLAPLPIHPALFPLAALVVLAGLVLVTSNTQKR